MINGFQPKFFEYLSFYILFSASILSTTHYTKYCAVNYTYINYIVAAELFFLLIFGFYEYYNIINNNGLITWIPRVGRESYGSNSIAEYFRIRLLTYESSSAGYLINIFYLVYFSTSNTNNKKTSVAIFITCLLLHLMTFSTIQILIFFAVVLLQARNSKKMLSAIFAILTLILVLLLTNADFKDNFIEAFYYMYNKIDNLMRGSGDSNSGAERAELFNIGFKSFSESPIFGEGLASFYRYVSTGLVSFYLQSLQQLGIIGAILLCCIMYFPVMFWNKFKLEIKLLFITVWATLIFSGGIQDSINYIPYLFIFRNEKK